ncbi:MAG: hypothetical protein NTZ19_13130 [Bacteroidetes bacterium]|nr:hypothetical protein [Bacteroidota bacterium]
MKNSILTFLEGHWDALLASIAGCIVIYFLTRFGGIGISPDSVGYSVAAMNLKEHGVLNDFNGLALVDFPAGYPIFLAANYFITGVQPIQLAPFINAGLYVGVILMSSVIMQSFSGIIKWYRIAFLVILASSPCLWEVYGMIWSETLFLFLVLLFVLAWKNYCNQKTIGSVFLFALVAACAFVTRFAGITLIATGAALLLFDGTAPGFKKIKNLLLFLITGTSLVVINLIRNNRSSGTLSGVREKALRTVADNLLDIGAVLGGWFPFIGEHQLAGAIVFCLLVAVATIQIIYRIIQQQFYLRNETAVYGFFLVYSVFIVAVSSISRFEDLSSRLLSPMYIPMLWVSTIWIPNFINQKTKAIRNTLLLVTAIFFLAFFKNQYQQNAGNWEGIAFAGIPGYSEKQWKESPTVQYINAHKDSLNGAIYSDAYDGLYYLTGVKSLPLPHKEIEKEKAAFLNHSFLIVIWFNDGVNTDLIDLDFIKERKKLVLTKSFDDGAIYFYKDSTISK